VPILNAEEEFIRIINEIANEKWYFIKQFNKLNKNSRRIANKKRRVR
jgi:hypothetical protein